MSEWGDDQDKPTQRLRGAEGRDSGPNTRRLGPLPGRANRPQEESTGYATSMTCPECGGEMVWARTAAYINPGLSLYVEPWNKDRAKRSPHGSELWALVCSDCGFTKLYARDPRKV